MSIPARWKVFAISAACCLAAAGGILFVAYEGTLQGAPLEVAAASPQLQQTLAWIVVGGYALIFLGMVVEGPLVTAAAAFGASLGLFNIWVVLIFAASADLIADVGFYLFGYFSRLAVLEKHGSKIGLSKERLEKLEQLLHAHPRKTILTLKLLPGMAVVGLPIVGALRVPLRLYVLTCLSFILPSVALFGALGYFFGEVYGELSASVQNAQYLIAVAVAGVLGVYYAYRKATAAFARRLDVI